MYIVTVFTSFPPLCVHVIPFSLCLRHSRESGNPIGYIARWIPDQVGNDVVWCREWRVCGNDVFPLEFIPQGGAGMTWWSKGNDGVELRESLTYKGLLLVVAISQIIIIASKSDSKQSDFLFFLLWRLYLS